MICLADLPRKCTCSHRARWLQGGLEPAAQTQAIQAWKLHSSLCTHIPTSSYVSPVHTNQPQNKNKIKSMNPATYLDWNPSKVSNEKLDRSHFFFGGGRGGGWKWKHALFRASCASMPRIPAAASITRTEKHTKAHIFAIFSQL